MEKSLIVFTAPANNPSPVSRAAVAIKTLSSPSTLPDRQIQDIFPSPKCLATVYKRLQLRVYTHKIDRDATMIPIRITSLVYISCISSFYNTNPFFPNIRRKSYTVQSVKSRITIFSTSAPVCFSAFMALLSWL